MEMLEDENKYLIFKLIDEYYACNILQVKEVIKIGKIKPVPFMISYFKGIINLRGKIISIIDYRMKISELFESKKNEGIILILENDEITIGAIVDDLLAVQTINSDSIQKNIDMKYSIDSKFVIGNYIYNEKLITIIDFISSINKDELKIIHDAEVLNLSSIS